MEYPNVLEQWWLAEMRRIVIKGGDDQSKLRWMEQHVAKMSDLFTVDRTANLGDYHKSDLQSLAYGLYFFPQTYMRVAYVLEELRARGVSFSPREDGKPLQVLDAGSGMGAAIFALAFRIQSPCLFTALDHSSPSLASLRRIAKDLSANWKDASFDTKSGDLKNPASWPNRGGYDIIISSFALNEAFEEAEPEVVQEWTKAALSKLSPNGILILVEPALSLTSQRLQSLRDHVLSKKLANVIAPCCHQRETCPMQEKQMFWCHEARRWKPPGSLSFIDRRLFRASDALKFSFLVFQSPWQAPVHSTMFESSRLVSPTKELKGRITAYGCATDGKIHSYEIQTRELSKPEKKAFVAVERGDIIEWLRMKEIGDQKVCRAEGFRVHVSPVR